MRDFSPESPEERRKHPDDHPLPTGWTSRLGPGTRPFEVLRRAFIGVYNDGFIHAGNLAYLTLLTLFPFCIVTAAIASLFGQSEESLAAINAVLKTMPPNVAGVLQQPITDVLTARTGPLLWLGALVGLWTVGSFVETIRDILRRAYGTVSERPFWHHRLRSIAIILISVMLMMAAFSAQLLLTATEEMAQRYIPASAGIIARFDNSRFIPLLILFIAHYLMFWSLTPSKYRGWRYPKWPGSVFIVVWWYGALSLLPRLLEQLGGYALTYGGLAGVIIALLFFWLIGYGLVIGAHLNAALADYDKDGLKDKTKLDELTEAMWLDT
ncbi:MAG: YihY/virulence factor BrkB family protein [Chakrabartia sp.]